MIVELGQSAIAQYEISMAPHCFIYMYKPTTKEITKLSSDVEL